MCSQVRYAQLCAQIMTYVGTMRRIATDKDQSQELQNALAEWWRDLPEHCSWDWDERRELGNTESSEEKLEAFCQISEAAMLIHHSWTRYPELREEHYRSKPDPENSSLPVVDLARSILERSMYIQCMPQQSMGYVTSHTCQFQLTQSSKTLHAASTRSDVHRVQACRPEPNTEGSCLPGNGVRLLWP